jgi:hypothetical protein
MHNRPIPASSPVRGRERCSSTPSARERATLSPCPAGDEQIEVARRVEHLDLDRPGSHRDCDVEPGGVRLRRGEPPFLIRAQRESAAGTLEEARRRVAEGPLLGQERGPGGVGTPDDLREDLVLPGRQAPASAEVHAVLVPGT